MVARVFLTVFGIAAVVLGALIVIPFIQHALDAASGGLKWRLPITSGTPSRITVGCLLRRCARVSGGWFLKPGWVLFWPWTVATS